MAMAFDRLRQRRLGRTGERQEAAIAATDLAALRAFYEDHADQAFAVARALTNDEATAEQVVFAAFVITNESSRESALNRNTLLGLVIAGTERLERGQTVAVPSHAGLTRRQIEALVLAMCAGCTLDDIVAITGVERRRTALDLRDGLRAIRNVAHERGDR